MTASALRPALELLAAGWPQELTREQITVYAEMLADVPPDELLAAVRRLIATNDFRPSVAEVRRTVIVARAGIPTPEQAAEQAEALDAWNRAHAVPWGAQPEPPPPPDVHPLVREAWRVAGDAAIPAVFARAFREVRDAWIGEAASRPLTEAPALGASRSPELGS